VVGAVRERVVGVGLFVVCVAVAVVVSGGVVAYVLGLVDLYCRRYYVR
jgi:hypothetical protein